MTATIYPQTTDYPALRLSWLGFLLLCVLITILITAVITAAHAIIRHGELAKAVENCRNNADPGSLLNFFDPFSGRRMEFCPLDDGNWGLSVYDQDGSNITRYIPRWARSIGEIVRKMKGRECFPIAGVEGCWLPLEKAAEVMR